MVWLWLGIAAASWGLWALVAHAILALSPRRDVLAGLAMIAMKVYGRLVHRLRVEGREHLPKTRSPGRLIVVSNHTAGVDPLLVQSICRFEITWTMAEDMRLPWAEDVWKWAGILFVDRKAGHHMAARAAMRRLEAGGVLGIFPEGQIERPRRHILPFLHGVGMLAKRMHAPVLPIIIEGTPDTETAWQSLWTPSRARIRVMPMIHYDRTLSPGDIAEDLRKRYLRWTGWPPGSQGPGVIRAEPDERPTPRKADDAA
jgi:1-acyl-sn-glycerol-3-phosphate acyltransferase